MPPNTSEANILLFVDWRGQAKIRLRLETKYGGTVSTPQHITQLSQMGLPAVYGV